MGACVRGIVDQGLWGTLHAELRLLSSVARSLSLGRTRKQLSSYVVAERRCGKRTPRRSTSLKLESS